ncbi:MAG: DUF378 domain-containing protein [Clostridia bacterium]|nr:DUF378 domain-containing protein [Clostridia bacterium]
MKTLNVISLILVIIGAINWGLVGLFEIDIVAAIFGSSDAMLSKIVYILIGLAGLWSLTFLNRFDDEK